MSTVTLNPNKLIYCQYELRRKKQNKAASILYVSWCFRGGYTKQLLGPRNMFLVWYRLWTQACFSGLHAIICYYALDDKDRMKQGFQMLLEVVLDIDDEEKYLPTSVSFLFKFSILKQDAKQLTYIVFTSSNPCL